MLKERGGDEEEEEEENKERMELVVHFHCRFLSCYFFLRMTPQSERAAFPLSNFPLSLTPPFVSAVAV